MSRVKINFPPQKHLFESSIPLRITDMNYGNHLGNDTLLSLLHEVRVQLLDHFKLTEFNIGDHTSLIMGDVMIKYIAEAFYGDEIVAYLWVDDFTNSSFQIYYRLFSKNKELKQKVIAEAKTGMVCFDYQERKVLPVPDCFKESVLKAIK